ncbi:MAG: ribosome silencing factor [Peptococcaceae bacterium]|nr:ribosome silencing factor [Peptococcaceae bacterium]
MNKTIEEFVRLMDMNKCEDITVLDMHGITYLADYFIIATIMNKPHADMICRKLEELNQQLTSSHFFRVEGKEVGDWLLIDTGDVIVHLFQAETRAYYNLDALWGDAERIDVSDLLVE